MISFFRSAQQMRRLFLLPRSALNKYYFSITAPFESGTSPSSSYSHTNQNLDLSTSQKQSSGSTSQSKGKPSSPEELSEVAQKAIWASAVINHIINSTPPKSIQRSVRDEIIQLRIPAAQQKFKLEDKYRDQIMDYFKEGVLIDEIVFNQERVQSVSTIDDKIRFFPTNSVSKIVFKIMKARKPNILMGSFGIGKTFSIILYIQLAKYVNHLRYLSYGKWIPTHTAERYKKQLDMLQNQQLIGNYPKYLYWSIKLLHNENDIRETIRLQLGQLSLPADIIKQLSSCNSLEELIVKIKKLHPDQSIFRKIAIDQINVATSLIRDWNQQVTQLKFRKKSLAHASKNAINNYKIPAQKFINFIDQYRRLGINYLLNSSYNLEKDLLKKINDKDKLSLRFFDHGQISPIELHYANQLKRQEVKLEFLQFFLFVLEQFFMQKPQYMEKFKLIKENFNQSRIDVKTYYRSLYVWNFFNDNFEKLEIQSLTKENIQDFIVNLKKKFNDQCLSSSKRRLESFIEQKKDEGVIKYKRMVIQVMLIQARLCRKHGIDKLKFSASRLQKMVKQYTHAKSMAKLQTYFTTNDHNNQLLPCIYNERDKTVQFDWQPKDFIEIAVPTLFPQTIDSKQFVFQRPLQELVTNRVQGTIGDFTEYFLRILLSQCPEVEFRSLTNSKKKLQEKKISFKINNIQTFVLFNELSKSNKKVKSETVKKNEQNQIKKEKQIRKIGSLKRNLSKLLQSSKKDPKSHHLGIPVEFKQIDSEMTEINAPQSQVIDMILVKFNQEKQIFEITTIDSTIEKNLGKKIKSAEKMLKKLLKKVSKYANLQQLNNLSSVSSVNAIIKQGKMTKTTQIQDPDEDHNKYIINHIFVCPAKNCLQQKVIIKDLLTISFFPLENIKFVDCEETEIHKSFELWKQLTIQDSNKQI